MYKAKERILDIVFAIAELILAFLQKGIEIAVMCLPPILYKIRSITKGGLK